MARETKRLSPRRVATATVPGRYPDGDGLYLIVDGGGAKRWQFHFRWDGKRREMGLGNFASTSLAEARQKAADARKLLGAKVDPIVARESASRAGQAASTTFGAFADDLIGDLQAGFRNQKHIAQWRMTLKVYGASLRDMSLDEIDTTAVLDVLKPIWLTKSETASRLRGRIERVLDAAKAKGLRTGENPARWRGHLDKLLSKRLKLTRGHHAAMAYEDVPAFLQRLRQSGGTGAAALQFLILTAARTSEVTGAKWSEVDLEAKIWTVPADRMKAGREHRVPLSMAALELLQPLRAVRPGEFIFNGNRARAAISSATMSKALITAGAGKFTVHGFRSTFRDWAGEVTSFSRETAEAALAHTVGDATERAYRRGDALEKRRELMTAWANFCIGTGKAKVIRLTGPEPRPKGRQVQGAS